MVVSLVADLGMELLPELETVLFFPCGMLSYVLFNYGFSVLVRVKAAKEIIADDNVEKYTHSTEDFGEGSSHDEGPGEESVFEGTMEMLWKDQCEGQEEDDSEWVEWISQQQDTISELREQEEAQEQEQKRCLLDDVETRIRRWMDKPFTLNKPPRQPLHQQEESDGQETVDPFDEPWESDDEEEDLKDAFPDSADSEQPVEARQPRRMDWFEATYQEGEDEAPWLARQRSKRAPRSTVSTPVDNAAHCRSDPNPEEATPSSGWTAKDVLPSVDEERWRHKWSPAKWESHKWEWRKEKGKPAAGTWEVPAGREWQSKREWRWKEDKAAAGSWWEDSAADEKPKTEWRLKEDKAVAGTCDDPAAQEKPKRDWRSKEDKPTKSTTKKETKKDA